MAVCRLTQNKQTTLFKCRVLSKVPVTKFPTLFLSPSFPIIFHLLRQIGYNFRFISNHQSENSQLDSTSFMNI